MEGLDSFIKEFNSVFEGAAVLSISPVKGEYLELTIGSRTASIQYPKIVVNSSENEKVSPKELLEYLKYTVRLSAVQISSRTGIASSSISAHLKGKTTKMHERKYAKLKNLVNKGVIVERTND